MLTTVGTPGRSSQGSQMRKESSFVGFAFVLFFIWMCGSSPHPMELAIELKIKNKCQPSLCKEGTHQRGSEAAAGDLQSLCHL